MNEAPIINIQIDRNTGELIIDYDASSYSFIYDEDKGLLLGIDTRNNQEYVYEYDISDGSLKEFKPNGIITREFSQYLDELNPDSESRRL